MFFSILGKSLCSLPVPGIDCVDPVTRICQSQSACFSDTSCATCNESHFRCCCVIGIHLPFLLHTWAEALTAERAFKHHAGVLPPKSKVVAENSVHGCWPRLVG